MYTKVHVLNRRFKDQGWRSAADQRFCVGCGETALVTETTIHGQTTFYCNVCSHTWKALDFEVCQCPE